MPNTLEPEILKALTPKQEKRSRERVRGKIRRLPPEVRHQLDERLASGSYDGFRGLSRWLEEEHGQRISPTTLAAYFKFDFNPALQAVRIATIQAMEIVRQNGDSDDGMNRALSRLVQATLFQMLVEMQRTRHLISLVPAAHHRSEAILKGRKKNSEDNSQPVGTEATGDSVIENEGEFVSKFPTKADLAAVAAVGRVVAMMAKTQLEWTKWRVTASEILAEKVAATTETVAVAVREGGLSPEAEATIRAALMEIKL
jgi:hypothetical protein